MTALIAACAIWADATQVLAQTDPSTLAAPAPTSVAAPAFPPLPSGQLDPARLEADQVAALARQMADGAPDQESRDQSARRLLTIGNNDARAALLDALKDLTHPGGRLAAARAVAEDAPPDPAFVDPLFVLVETAPSRPVMDAAALALGNYKALPEVSTRLAGLTSPNQPAAVRVVAIHALAMQVEKRAAARLVELAQESGSPDVSAEAIAGLQSFTHLAYETPSDWASWWRTQQNVPEDSFRLDALTARVTRAEQQARRGGDMFAGIDRLVSDQLNAAPRDQRGDLLNSFLSSPNESMRLVAIRRAAIYSADLPESVRPSVRRLIGDVSPDVRLEAAQIVQNLADADAFAAVAQQAAVEPDPRVRAKLADVLGRLGNLDALPILRSMLDDPSNLVVQSSAGALNKIGDALVQARPNDANELAIRLQRVLETRTPTGSGTLRQSLIAALVPLRQRSLLPTFVTMLTQQPPESPVIRAEAAQALGAIGDPAIESPLVGALDDPNPQVRLAAVNALDKVMRDFNTAPRLLLMLDPTAEPDANVRAAAWNAISDKLTIAPTEQLVDWPDKALLKPDEDKRIAIFTVLADRYAKMERREDQTAMLQQIGDSHMHLGDIADSAGHRDVANTEFAQAAQVYGNALALATQGGTAMSRQHLTIWQTRALLRGRDYAGAARFVRSVNAEYREPLGAEWKTEADRLASRKTADDDANALDLIATATQMGTALPSLYQSQLGEIRTGIEHRQNEKNEFAIPDWMHALCMR